MMANRPFPNAKAFGNPTQLNHAKRSQESVVTDFDSKTLPLPRVRQEGLNKEANKAVTGVAATDLFTSTGHGFLAGDRVRFAAPLTGGAGITVGQDYWVIASGLTANDFRVSATKNGTTIDLTTDLTAGTIARWIPAMVGAHSVSGRNTPDIAGPRQ
jgi:hypothetical protein